MLSASQSVKMSDIFVMMPDNGTDAEFDNAIDKLNDYFKPQVNI